MPETADNTEQKPRRNSKSFFGLLPKAASIAEAGYGTKQATYKGLAKIRGSVPESLDKIEYGQERALRDLAEMTYAHCAHEC